MEKWWQFLCQCGDTKDRLWWSGSKPVEFSATTTTMIVSYKDSSNSLVFTSIPQKLSKAVDLHTCGVSPGFPSNVRGRDVGGWGGDVHRKGFSSEWIHWTNDRRNNSAKRVGCSVKVLRWHEVAINWVCWLLEAFETVLTLQNNRKFYIRNQFWSDKREDYPFFSSSQTIHRHKGEGSICLWVKTPKDPLVRSLIFDP